MDYEAQREIMWDAFKARRDLLAGKVFKAEVLSWSGTEGLVRGLTGEGQWWLNSACMTHTEGQIIDVEVNITFLCRVTCITHKA
mgnify:CR=1 FL=1